MMKKNEEKRVSRRIDICAVCAWRAQCQKKFSISGRDIKCPDFVRDISLSQIEEKGGSDHCKD